MNESTPNSHQATSQNDQVSSADFPGNYEEFVAALPKRLQRIAKIDLRHLWERARQNAHRAQVLENRSEELGVIFERLSGELESQGMTFEDLVAFERQRRGFSVFPGEPDYLVPASYHHIDRSSG